MVTVIECVEDLWPDFTRSRCRSCPMDSPCRRAADWIVEELRENCYEGGTAVWLRMKQSAQARSPTGQLSAGTSRAQLDKCTTYTKADRDCFGAKVVGAQCSGATEQIRFLSLAGLNEGHPDLYALKAGSRDAHYFDATQPSNATRRSVIARRFNICIPNAIIVTGIGDPTGMVNHLQPESCRESFRMSYLGGPAQHWRRWQACHAAFL